MTSDAVNSTSNAKPCSKVTHLLAEQPESSFTVKQYVPPNKKRGF